MSIAWRPSPVLLALAAVALAARALTAWLFTQPGYMDAAYYFDGAASLARGQGFREDFVWNYLSPTGDLPQPGNAQWMPLASIVMAPFLWLFGPTYRAGQIPMVVLAALLIPLTYRLSLKLFQRQDWAITSALLMLASSFYLPYWTATDGFALYGLIGAAALGLMSYTGKRQRLAALGCGMLIGLAHLTRADGLLLAAPLILTRPAQAAHVRRGEAGARVSPRERAGQLRAASPIPADRPNHRGSEQANRGMLPSYLALALAGYALVMFPWLWRNVQVFGAPLVGANAMFMVEYNDLFRFEQAPAFDAWLASGWANILGVRLRALTLNVATLAGALHFVFLPFALIGLRSERRAPLVRAGAIYLLALLAVMSLVFSLPGPRGTFLHSLTAILPLLYALAPVGLAACVKWVAARRSSWNARQAERIFGAAFLALAGILTAYFSLANLLGSASEAGWNQRFIVYQAVEAHLRAETGDAASPVVCINPPAYYYFNRRPAIMIPTDDPLALVRAAGRYGARFVVVEADHPAYLNMLYNFEVSDSRFHLLATFSDPTGAQVQLYQITPVR
ncbi:MAG: hypothetical protein HY259_14550 [Chloroflexi bacterium]|nr:hypothetical protein [Chloroflexota bacterium]